MAKKPKTFESFRGMDGDSVNFEWGARAAIHREIVKCKNITAFTDAMCAFYHSVSLSRSFSRINMQQTTTGDLFRAQYDTFAIILTRQPT